MPWPPPLDEYSHIYCNQQGWLFLRQGHGCVWPRAVENDRRNLYASTIQYKYNVNTVVFTDRYSDKSDPRRYSSSSSWRDCARSSPFVISEWNPKVVRLRKVVKNNLTVVSGASVIKSTTAIWTKSISCAGNSVMCCSSLRSFITLYQQCSTFLPLQPSSAETRVRRPKDEEKGAVSSSSQRWHSAAVPPSCWLDQQRAYVSRMALGADLSLSA